MRNAKEPKTKIEPPKAQAEKDALRSTAAEIDAGGCERAGYYQACDGDNGRIIPMLEEMSLYSARPGIPSPREPTVMMAPARPDIRLSKET